MEELRAELQERHGRLDRAAEARGRADHDRELLEQVRAKLAQDEDGAAGNASPVAWTTSEGKVMDWKLELVVVPVTDVDRAKHFYGEQLGFVVDHDTRVGDGDGDGDAGGAAHPARFGRGPAARLPRPRRRPRPAG